MENMHWLDSNMHLISIQMQHIHHFSFSLYTLGDVCVDCSCYI